MNAVRLKPFALLRGRLYPDDPEVGDLPMLFLVYLAFLLLPLGFRNGPPMPWLQTIACAVLFLPLYFWGWWRPPHLATLCLTMAALGLYLVPVNPGANTFTIFALAQAAELRSARQAWALLVGILGSFGLACWWLDLPNVVLITAAIPGIAVFSGIRSLRQAQMKRAVLKLSQDEVRRLGELAERERIARDLHDLIGHTLSVVVLKSELARKLVSRDPERASREIGEVETLARRSLEEVRQTLRGIRQASFLQELAQARLGLEAAGVRSHFEVSELPAKLADEIEVVLAFALREAVTNVIRHANANTLVVELKARDRHLELEIRDDGRGGVNRQGQGLLGMAERVRNAGGTLTVDSRRGEGTRLALVLPLPAVCGAPAQVAAAAWAGSPAT
jgi:two-component system, NarL family, sensor histidine kinase DesK